LLIENRLRQVKDMGEATVRSEAMIDLLETLERAGRFQTFVGSMNAAGLSWMLQGLGPFTVLAPCDDAFARLPRGTVGRYLDPENRRGLLRLLRGHLLAGRIGERDMRARGYVRTLHDVHLTVSRGPMGLRLAGAGVVRTDIQAANGIIHVLDRVLTGGFERPRRPLTVHSASTQAGEARCDSH
jgi:uncharacterized surface protein with fasciclin (FAS1) repeats